MNAELKALTAASDNLLMYRLGLMASEVAKLGPDKCGDEIDRGLIMLRLMNERGMKVFFDPQSNTAPKNPRYGKVRG